MNKTKFSKKTILLAIVFMGFFSPLFYIATAQAFTPDHSREVGLYGVQTLWGVPLERFHIRNEVAVETVYNSLIGGYVIHDYETDDDFDVFGWWFFYRIYHWEDISRSTTLLQAGPYIIRVTYTIYGRVEASSSNYMEITISVWVDCEGNSGFTMTVNDHLSSDMDLEIYTS